MCEGVGYMGNLNIFFLSFAVDLKLLYQIKFILKTTKKCHWHFNRDCIESGDYLGSMRILTKSILPIYEPYIAFYLFVSSSFPFINLYINQSFYFLVFYSSDEDCFHNFSFCSFLMYKNAIIFWILILYLSTLLHSFILIVFGEN